MSLFDFDKEPDRYAVMGNPVTHSKSPRIHALFAGQTGQRLCYDAIQVDPGGFAQAVGNFVAHGGKGLNITVPFKEEAFRLVDHTTDRAGHAGAVNTITVKRDGLYGDNTDGIGLVRDIARHGGELAGRELLLLGCGGAARGIIAPLLAQAPKRLYIANRTASKAMDVAALFLQQGDVQGGGFSELRGRFDWVINATSASLHHESLALATDILNSGAWCYDLMYGQLDNPFAAWARQAGAEKLLDGLGMLVEQAAESFYIWRGVMPETAAVWEVLGGKS